MLQEVYGRPNAELALAASGLMGGIGNHQDVCGALVGGVLALGLRPRLPEDEFRRRAAELREAAHALYDAFVAEFGAADCRTLIGIDLSGADAGIRYRESGVKFGRCFHFVAFVVRRLTLEQITQNS